MALRLKIEETEDGLRATISQRGDDGKPSAPATVFRVANKDDAKRRAKEMARALGLKTYGLIDKTDDTKIARSEAPHEEA